MYFHVLTSLPTDSLYISVCKHAYLQTVCTSISVTDQFTSVPMSLTGERKVQQDGRETKPGPVRDPGGAVRGGAAEGETPDGAGRQGE